MIKRDTLLHHHKASSLVRRYKFRLIMSARLLPSQENFAPKLDMSYHWMFGTCSATTTLFMTTTTVIPGQNHVRIWVDHHPNMVTKAQSLPETGLPQTPESLCCHHFVMCSGLPSRCWPRSLLFNLHDRIDILPNRQKS
jgi:hypothetical protein